MSTPVTPAAPAAPAPTATPEASSQIQEQSQTPEPSDAELDADLDSPEAIEAAAQSGDITKQQAADLKKKYKIKVDGEESEYEFDPSDEKQITSIIQKAKAFEKRGGEFTKAQQQLLAKMQEMDNDPEGYLTKKGVDLDKWAVERLEKKVQEMAKTPAEIEQEKKDKRIKELEERFEKEEQEKNKLAQERARDEQAKLIQDDITAAIAKTGSKIPDKDPYFLQQMSAYMLAQMAKGNVDVSVEDTLKVLEGNMKKDLGGFFNRLDEDAILEFLGEENFERIRKKRYQAKKASAASAGNVQTTTAKQAAKDTGTRRDSQEAKPKKKFGDFFGKV